MDGKKRPEEKVREGLESARDAVIGRIGEKRVKKNNKSYIRPARSCGASCRRVILLQNRQH